MSDSLITGGILAGGQGSRMGGVDKGWVDYEGTPLIEVVLQRLKPQVDTLIINANRNFERYDALGYPVAQDQTDGYQGPLAGVAALMAAAKTPYLLIVPCDGPVFPLNLAHRLLAALKAEATTIAIAADTERYQPTYALLPTHLGDELNAFMAGGGRKIMAWYQQYPLSSVRFDQRNAFMNINSLDQLR